MRRLLASRIMPRTTLNLDSSVLSELKRRQREENKPLGRLASELLARALAEDRHDEDDATFDWVAARMHVRVDLEDHEAVEAAIDESTP